MIKRVFQLGQRVIYLGIAVLGLLIALGGYPPPTAEPPIQLVVGSIIILLGLAGMIWPEKIRSGSGSVDDID